MQLLDFGGEARVDVVVEVRQQRSTQDDDGDDQGNGEQRDVAHHDAGLDRTKSSSPE